MAQRGPKWAQPVIDYAGLAAFGLTYAVTTLLHLSTNALLTASWGLAAGSALGLLVGFAVQKRLAVLPLCTGLSAIIFSGLSLIFHNTIFIGIKLTVIDGLIALGLFTGVAMGKQPLKSLLGEALKLSDGAWRNLTVRYGLFFVAVAIVNLFLFFGLRGGAHEGWWVGYRTLGVPILAVLFSLSQVPMISRDMHDQHIETAHEDIEPPPAD